MLQWHCTCADGIHWCMQLTEGGVLFFRESCFKPSGDKKRGNNPTHYRCCPDDTLKLWVHSISILSCLHAIAAVAPAMTVDIIYPGGVLQRHSNAWLAVGHAAWLILLHFVTAVSARTSSKLRCIIALFVSIAWSEPRPVVF